MAQSAVLTNIEGVKWWFDNLPSQQRRWKLYHGHLDNMSQRSKVFMESGKDMSVEESWSMLEQALRVSSVNGGKYTLYIPISDAAKHGPNAKINLNQVQASSRQSLNGVPIGYVPESEIERRLKEFEEKMELKRRIEDLEAGQQANLTWHERLQEWLFDGGGAEALAPYVGPLIGAIIPNAKGLGTLQQVQSTQEPQGEAVQDKDPQLELLQAIRDRFPDDASYLQAVETIKNKVTANPAAIMALLQNMENGQ